MNYQCTMCKATFIHPAKLVITNPTTEKNAIDVFEVSTCPHCKSIEYTETEKIETRVTKVLVVDLVSGENLALNKALADGYEIVGRYAKQYTLELKEKPVQKDLNQIFQEGITAAKAASESSFKNPDPDSVEVFMEQAEAAYKKLEEA